MIPYGAAWGEFQKRHPAVTPEQLIGNHHEQQANTQQVQQNKREQIEQEKREEMRRLQEKHRLLEEQKRQEADLKEEIQREEGKVQELEAQKREHVAATPATVVSHQPARVVENFHYRRAEVQKPEVHKGQLLEQQKREEEKLKQEIRREEEQVQGMEEQKRQQVENQQEQEKDRIIAQQKREQERLREELKREQQKLQELEQQREQPQTQQIVIEEQKRQPTPVFIPVEHHKREEEEARKEKLRLRRKYELLTQLKREMDNLLEEIDREEDKLHDLEGSNQGKEYLKREEEVVSEQAGAPQHEILVRISKERHGMDQMKRGLFASGEGAYRPQGKRHCTCGYGSEEESFFKRSEAEEIEPLREVNEMYLRYGRDAEQANGQQNLGGQAEQ